MTHLLAFAGSLRAASFNKRLVPVLAAGARGAGAEVTTVDLADFALPLFDQDLESASGMPEPARRLRRLMVEADGLLLASPEYNSSVSGALKNAIDWASRLEEGGSDGALAAFRGKVAGIVAASPGALGGLRGLVHLRDILGNLGMLVVPEQHALSKAHEAFDGEHLKDDKARARVEAVGASVARVAAALRGP